MRKLPLVQWELVGRKALVQWKLVVWLLVRIVPLVQWLLLLHQLELLGDEQHAAYHAPSGLGHGDVGAEEELQQEKERRGLCPRRGRQGDQGED